jgi:hypothetical protein
MEVNANDFVFALVCELRRRGVIYVSPRTDQLEPAAVAAFEVLERHPELELRFLIIPNRAHGDSQVLRDALRQNWSLIGPPINEDHLRICIGSDDAEELLARQEIPREICQEMGDAFLERYQGDVPARPTAKART